MAEKKKATAKKTASKTSKPKAKKEEVKVDETTKEEVGKSNAAASVEDVQDGGKGKAPNSIDAPGKFVVVEFKDGFRMYNEKGQAVSEVRKADEKNAEGQNFVSQMRRKAARSNALRRSREIKTPAGHEQA